MKNIFKFWCQFKLSLKGKISIINTLVIPLFLYICNSIYTSEEVVNEIKQEIKNFICDNKPAKIRYNTLIQNIEKGGLKLQNIELKIKSSLLNWINIV